MSFEWGDFLGLAKKLANEPDESSKRSAISRAYYAAYHAAEDYLDDHGVRPSTKQDSDKHRFVWESLKNGPNRRERAASRGVGLKKKRKEADYERRFPGDLAKAVQQAITEAESIIQEVARKSPKT